MQIVTWLTAHSGVIVGILLALSEAVAAMTQLLFPDNKGLSGIFAGIIKFLQGLQSKPST